MRTETINRTLYKFSELSDSAKGKVRDWYREGALQYDWWEFTYEDAERIGLKITSFDLGRSQGITGKLLKSPGEICSLIIANHGKSCDTYKLAADYFRDRHNGKSTDAKDFEYSLLQEYLSLLTKEEEYLMSDESVDESIEANEYEFLETGGIA